MRLLLAALAAAALLVPALARDTGQYDNADPSLRAWFRAQKSPKNGMFCCSEADGIYAEEDIRNGHYWTRWKIEDETTAWTKVPDDVVIHDPNRQGAPVVWFFFQDGRPQIRCYAPGVLI